MISITPMARSNETSAKRRVIIRMAATCAIAMAVLAFAASRLANLTGDMLSASVLVLTALVTMIVIVAPRSRSRNSHG